MLTPLAVVVPAAGRSSRMGSSKLLLELDGESLLTRAVRTAAAVDPTPTVVLRPGDRAARETLAGTPCRTVVNARPELGPARSIACGIAAVPEGLPVLILLPDMPFVGPRLLRTLVEGYRADAPGSHGAVCVTARYGDVLAPPVILHPSVLPGLVGAAGRLRDHLRRAGVSWKPVDLPPWALTDVDTPRDRVRWLGG